MGRPAAIEFLCISSSIRHTLQWKRAREDVAASLRRARMNAFAAPCETYDNVMIDASLLRDPHHVELFYVRWGLRLSLPPIYVSEYPEP